MTYFEDHTAYHYSADGSRLGTVNIGWLASGYDFPKKMVTDDVLRVLWEYSKVAVCPTRGGHTCDFCDDKLPIRESRNGLNLLLGTAEIRIFAENGVIYAAPNALYHYVKVHNYELPSHFVSAMLNQGPPGREYFDKLGQLGVEWGLAPEFEPSSYMRFKD